MAKPAARALAPLALMGAIFYLSAQPPSGPDLPEIARVMAHFTEYALLTALWWWALAPLESGASTTARPGSASQGRRALWWAAAISLLYAVSDEFHQSFVADRDADPFDVLVDAVGIAVAAIAIRALITSRRGRA